MVDLREEVAALKRGRPALRDWHLAILVPIAVLLLCLIPRAFSPTYFYWDDTMQSFLPVWRALGAEILSGNFELMDPNGWAGGNYMAEVGYGIWNPLNILNFMVVSTMTDLALASFYVVAQFMALLGLATFLLTRGYGANRFLAAAAGIALPFSGFTLFYEAARWPGGLMAFAWTTLFWWSLRRALKENRSPFLPFLIGFLTMTAGNPYGALGVILVSAGVGLELLLERKWTKLVWLFFIALAVGLTAVLVFFPLPLSSDVTVRTESTISNNMFLVPGIGDLTAMSAPNFRPAISNFWGIIEAVPTAYLAWFVLPLVPFLNYRALAARTKQLSSLYVITGFYFLMTFAPSNVLLFRWPVRLLEYTYLGILVVFMVALSSGLMQTHLRRRLIFAGGIIAFGVYRSWAIYPEAIQSQLVAGAMVAALLALGLFLYRRAGYPGLATAMAIGTVVVISFQGYAFISHNPVAGIGSPMDAEVLEESTQSYRGNTLQVMSFQGLDPDAFVDGSLLYGNQILNAGIESSLNRYSGISFVKYVNALCMNYRGETCPAVYELLWEPASSDVPEDLADALRLETVVVQRNLVDIDDYPHPEGWEIIESDQYRDILQRQDPLPYDGTVSWASPSINVLASEREGDSETVSLEAPEDGELMFARLAWPGYEVTVDGVVQELEQGPAGLLTVDVPAGSSEVSISFTPPGLAIGMIAMAVAWTLAVGLTILHLFHTRKAH